MQGLENHTLQLFIDKLVKKLKEYNEENEENVNIPFVISSLHQSFKNKTNTYKEFVDDINFYYDYWIEINNSDNDYSGIIDAIIYLEQNAKECGKPSVCCNYYYKICFNFDERYYGYCECTPDMQDYREDKHCCGHGCDANFSSFSMYKIININNDSWCGDEHDYWDFEDDFYKSEVEIAEKIKKEEIEREIRQLKNQIEEYSKRLAELIGDN